MRTRAWKRGKPNALKLWVLQSFQKSGGWIRPDRWAVSMGYYPTKLAYTYLLRLHRFGLLNRGKDGMGRVVYRISDKGRERILWLLKHRSLA